MAVKKCGRKGEPMPDFARVFGLNVRQRRTDLGLKQRQVGDKIGISHQQISSIENGLLPSMDVAIKLAQYLKVPLSDLVGDSLEEEERVMPGQEDDAIPIRVLKLLRDLSVAPADQRNLIATWISNLGHLIQHQQPSLPEGTDEAEVLEQSTPAEGP